jgi:hypothetical protein
MPHAGFASLLDFWHANPLIEALLPRQDFWQ